MVLSISRMRKGALFQIDSLGGPHTEGPATKQQNKVNNNFPNKRKTSTKSKKEKKREKIERYIVPQPTKFREF